MFLFESLTMIGVGCHNSNLCLINDLFTLFRKEHFGEELASLMNKMLLVSQVAGLAKDIERNGGIVSNPFLIESPE